jgi:sulfate ABC transporter permease protein CysT
MVTDSVVVFIVRPGNPNEIASWDDPLADGVEVLTPNPLTSGGARWNIMAAWGALLEQGKTEDEAIEYLRQLFTHVPVQDKSARESLATFAGGKGDVLLGYENEVITAQQKGEQLEFVVPEQTILIENPVAVVTESANPRRRPSSLPSCAHPRRSESSASMGIARSCPMCSRRSTTRQYQQSLHPARSRRLADCDDEVLRSGLMASWLRYSSEALSPSSSAAPGRAYAGLPRRELGCPARHSRSNHHGLLERDHCIIPLAAVLFRSTGEGWAGFWESVTSPQALAALRLSLVGSIVVVVINAVVGTVIAWVLVRDDFAGKQAVNALIDLPFALPTIVAGLTLIALYGSRSPLGINIAYTQLAVVLALLFVTLPFVVRAVQPVLAELDREMEQAATALGASSWTTFRLIVLPNLLPAILAGAGLGFARAIGEFGSVVSSRATSRSRPRSPRSASIAR